MTRLDRVNALYITLMPMTRSSRVMTNLPPVGQSFGTRVPGSWAAKIEPGPWLAWVAEAVMPKFKNLA